MVPNKELREAFQRSHLTAKDVARLCEWYKGKNPKPDDSRVYRALGMMKVKNRSGYAFNKNITEDNALKLIEAMGYDAVDFRDSGL